MDDNLVPDATAGLVAADVRVPYDIEVVAHANLPHSTPSAVPARRIGFNVRQLYDLIGSARIVDGGSGAATVDLGAIEFDPNFMDPTLVAAQTSYKGYTGTTVTVPVSVAPAAGGAVTAAVTYGDDLSGPASISLPDGAGPVNLAVAIAASLSQPSGSPSLVVLDETTARGVEPGEFTVYSYERVVKISTATEVFVPENGTLDISVLLADAGLAAPGAISVSVGTQQGWGTNFIEWPEGALIADEGVQSEGALAITGGIGVNTITLSVDNGFVFAETDAASITITVIGFASPLYVATTGSDETGTGSEANPFRTITHAMRCTAVGSDTVVYVAAGSYDLAGGEVFPISVPGDCSIIGVAGPDRDAGDSTVISTVGTAVMLTPGATPSGAAPVVWSGLVLTQAKGTTITTAGWTATIDNCVITSVTSAAATASAILGTNCRITANRLVVKDINTSAENVINLTGGGSFTMTNSLMQNLRCLAVFYGGGIIYTVGLTVKITDSVFDNLGQTNGQVEGGVLCFWYGSFLMDRCVVKNFTAGPGSAVMCNRTSSAGVIRDTLFTNIQNGDYGAASCFFGNLDVRNCTFDNCSTAIYANWGTYLITARNTSVSNCGKLNSDAVAGLRLYSVNIWNVPDSARYDAANSLAVTAFDPGYADAANGDYHLLRESALVDAGNNTYVNWTDPTDLDNLPHIADGNADETETVDIGC